MLVKKSLFRKVLVLVCTVVLITAAYQAPLLAADTGSTCITVDIPFNNVSVQINNGVAQFQASEVRGEPGQPSLPVYSATLLLPADADLDSVSLSIDGLVEEPLAGTYDVEPALPPMSDNGYSWPQDRTFVNGKDIAVYNTDAIHPKAPYKILDLGQKSCYKLIDVQVNLFRYNPVLQKLYQFKGGKLVVNVNKDTSYASRASGIVPQTIKTQVSNLVSNYDAFASGYDTQFPSVRAGKMVIITTNAIKSGSQKFNAFLNSKKNRGMDVQVVTESDWGGGIGSTAANNIRNWLQKNYLTLGIHHVLLIGNSNLSSGDVPMMNFPNYFSSDSCPADWPYAQLTGDFKSDKKCEVSVGRIPVYNNDMATLDAILQKTIDYESASKDSIAWRKNALFGAGGYSSASKGDRVYEAVHNNYILKTPPWKDYRIYGTNYGQPTGTPDKIGISTTIFTEQWRTGSYGIVDWCTHGSPTAAQYVFSSSNAKQVGNRYPSFVLCGSCSNATITYNTNLTYSILRDCGMGAIGGTNLTYYSPNSQNYLETAGSDEGWAYNFAKFMIQGMEIGDALTALRELDPNFGWSNRGPYVLYGDPSIGIETCNSGNITPPPTNTPTPTPTPTSTPTSSKFTISGYIKPDLTPASGSESVVNGGFRVELTGTSLSSTTDGRGYFEITNVPPSSMGYIISITKAGYLKRNIFNIIVKSNIQLGTVDMWAGDFSGGGTQDNVINMADIIELSKGYNTTSGSTNFNPDYDLNKDSAVNMSDIMIITKHFNKTSADYPVIDIVVPTSTPTGIVPTSTPTPTKLVPTMTPIPTSGYPVWSGSSKVYNVGDRVSFSGSIYECIQTHTSNSAWDPASTLNILWKKL